MSSWVKPVRERARKLSEIREALIRMNQKSILGDTLGRTGVHAKSATRAPLQRLFLLPIIGRKHVIGIKRFEPNETTHAFDITEIVATVHP